MGVCVGMRPHTNERCGNETKPGWKYCDECKDKPRAVEEAQQKAITNLGTAKEQAKEKFRPRNEVVRAREEAKAEGVMANTSPQNIVDQVNQMLERCLNFEQDAFTAYSRLSIEDWSFKDKAGSAQLAPEIGVYERALDRAGRVLPMIAKLGIEQQAAIIEKAQYEGVKAAMTRTLIRLGFDESQMREANKIIAEEFRKLMG